MALCDTAKQGVWFRALYTELGYPQALPEPGKVRILVDNQGARGLAQNPKNHPKTKHIDVAG